MCTLAVLDVSPLNKLKSLRASMQLHKRRRDSFYLPKYGVPSHKNGRMEDKRVSYFTAIYLALKIGMFHGKDFSVKVVQAQID